MKTRLFLTISLILSCLFTGLRCFNHLNAWLGFLFIGIGFAIFIHETIYYFKQQKN